MRVHASTRTCTCADTTGLRFSWQVVCCWQDEAVNAAGTEMLSWGLTEASEVKVKLGFKDSSLNFPLEESHSRHCFRNSNMCSWQAICSCFHIQTFYVGYALLGGRHRLWSAEIANFLHDAPQYTMKLVILRFARPLSFQSSQPTLTKHKKKIKKIQVWYCQTQKLSYITALRKKYPYKPRRCSQLGPIPWVIYIAKSYLDT